MGTSLLRSSSYSSSTDPPWHWTYEGYRKSGEPLCFHCRWVIPWGLPKLKLTMWWSPGFLFSTPGPQPVKNWSVNYSILATSLTVLFVRTHLQIRVNALAVVPQNVLQRYISNVSFPYKGKTKGHRLCTSLMSVGKLVTGLGSKFCSPDTTSPSSWHGPCTLIRSGRQQVGGMKATGI